MNHRLRGSTLVETLVMMLVAGIVFLSVMDGLRMFTELQTRRMVELAEAGRQAAGYCRAEALVAGSDSIRGQAERLELFRAGGVAVLEVSDSCLIYCAAEFRDTLMTGVGELRLAVCRPLPDTVCIGMRGFTARFPVMRPVRETYREAVSRLEETYGYEE